jgi:hypothetical protein
VRGNGAFCLQQRTGPRHCREQKQALGSWFIEQDPTAPTEFRTFPPSVFLVWKMESTLIAKVENERVGKGGCPRRCIHLRPTPNQRLAGRPRPSLHKGPPYGVTAGCDSGPGLSPPSLSATWRPTRPCSQFLAVKLVGQTMVVFSSYPDRLTDFLMLGTKENA